MSPNLARIQAGIQLNKKSPNLAKILVILLNLSLKLSLKSAKMQRNHPNFRIFNRKSGPSPIWWCCPIYYMLFFFTRPDPCGDQDVKSCWRCGRQKQLGRRRPGLSWSWWSRGSAANLLSMPFLLRWVGMMVTNIGDDNQSWLFCFPGTWIQTGGVKVEGVTVVSRGWVGEILLMIVLSTEF